jgi:hypothetical protein
VRALCLSYSIGILRRSNESAAANLT